MLSRPAMAQRLALASPASATAGGSSGAGTFVALLVWVLLVFNVVPEGFDFAARENTMPTEGSAVSRAVWLGLLGSSLVVLAWRSGITLTLLRVANPFLLLFVVLATASFAWSMDPGVTLRRLVRVYAVAGCAFALAVVDWPPGRLQAVLRPVLLTLVAVSTAATLALPDFGIMPGSSAELAGAWRGITTHKNVLGSLASLGTLLWLHALLAGPAAGSRRGLAAPATVLCAACLLMSRSSTSLLATLVAAPVLLVTVWTPAAALRALRGGLIGLALLLLLYTLIILQVVPGLLTLLEPIAALTGKDLGFTGRTELWAIMREEIARHPVLGGGFGAFWVGAIPTSPSYTFLTQLYFYPGQAHNGYLDVVNDLGWLGGAALMGFMAVYLAQALRLLPLDRWQAALYLAIFFQQLVSNLAESRWWNVLTVEFIIVTMTVATLARDGIEARLRHLAARG